MMDEHQAIVLGEVQGITPNPPTLLRELRDTIQEMFPDVGRAGRMFILGHGQASLAKAAEIKARAMAQIMQLELDYQRLANEREANALKESHNHQQEMYKHGTDRIRARAEALKNLVEAIKEIRALGITLNASITKRLGEMLLTTLDEG